LHLFYTAANSLGFANFLEGYKYKSGQFAGPAAYRKDAESDHGIIDLSGDMVYSSPTCKYSPTAIKSLWIKFANSVLGATEN